MQKLFPVSLRTAVVASVL